MKLLYITNQICGSAGLERVLAIKTNFLIEEYGYEIHILTLNQFDLPIFYDFNKKIRYHDVVANGNSLKYIKAYTKGLKRVVADIKPDIISVCDDGLKGFFAPWILKKPCPMVYERHVSKNIELTEDKVSFKQGLLLKAKNKLMHYGGNMYHKFVVLTNDNLNEWQLNNLAVISNPLSFYPPDNAALKNKVVLAVGRQSFQKGYDRLLNIWKIVVEKHPDWQLKIYGKIDENLQLGKLACNLKISQSVNFYPPVKDIEKAYKEASIYVMSSRFEGFGMVLIEAMACGVPTISFDCPCGPKDIITNGEDGFLIPNNKLEDFAASISKMIEEEETRSKMGIKAKQNVKRFLPAEIVPLWHQLFMNLLTPA